MAEITSKPANASAESSSALAILGLMGARSATGINGEALYLSDQHAAPEIVERLAAARKAIGLKENLHWIQAPTLAASWSALIQMTDREVTEIFA